jgi:mono/diheme cytochrome c family protein
MKYRGVSLRSLLDVVERNGRSDLVLLHFANGMAVPLPIDDLEVLKTLDPFVATELQVAGLWITAFPMVTKGPEGHDVRPLKFQANKLVVSTVAHPFTTKASQGDGFTPFKFADTLTGIEFVRAEEWYKQFDLGRTDGEKAGFVVFKSHCQFCHSVREVGGRYGIDFAKPAPVVDRIGVQGLYLHVRYRDRDAPEKGQMMPFFKDVTKDEVTALHAWLTLITKARPVPYVAPPSL